jgi:hypothetical protein
MVTSTDLQLDLQELSVKLQRSVKLDHLFSLTDNVAFLQHAEFSVPAKKKGYTVDDNARALVFAVKGRRYWPSKKLSEFQRKMISFLLLMQADDGRFYNLMDFSHRYVDDSTVGDHLGRAIWATGAVLNSDLPNGLKASARRMFDQALPWARDSNSLRTKAYTCLGLCERFQTETNDSNLKANIEFFANDLLASFEANRDTDWQWFEKILSYDNARLPQALFWAHQCLRTSKYLDVAHTTFQFLQQATTTDGYFAPIGNRGWYIKGGHRALYDQQPIEAGAMIETSAFAYKMTGTELYEKTLRQALGWFFGMNTKSVTVYDEQTGACHDGISEKGLNENQGAESTISFPLAIATFLTNSA